MNHVIWRSKGRACPPRLAARAVRPDAPAVPIPQSIYDISNGNILGYGADLSEDHPGYHDTAYKQRRVAISQLAGSHEISQRIADVEYLPEEMETWATALNQLSDLIPRYACREFLDAYRELNFQPDKVPQLQEIHDVLQARSGWSIRPVAGLMHPRDFLNGLAFRTFHSTQYMRHHSNPMYTPEPDVVHEILGHVPMLMNPEFCALAEEIGKASLGASEKTIWHLTKVYWYTVEFGVVLEGKDIKAFGAGVLSSYGELEWVGSGKPQFETFSPWHALPKMSYKDGFQQKYFVLESFKDGSNKLKSFSKAVQESGGEWTATPKP